MRRFALIALKFAISAVLLYFAFSRVSWQTVLERLHRLDWFYVTLALAIGILQIGAVAIRWRRIAQACGAALSTSLSMRFNLIGAFFGQVLPSTVGGDATRIWLVARIAGSGWRAATYSVLLDRFFGVFALAFVVTAGLYWSFALIQDPVGRLVLLAIGLGSLVGLGDVSWRSVSGHGWPLEIHQAAVRHGADRRHAHDLARRRTDDPLVVGARPSDDGGARLECGASGRRAARRRGRRAAGAASDADRDPAGVDRGLGRARDRVDAGVSTPASTETTA